MCVFDAAAIVGLQAEGHPISNASIGEQITIGGLQWGAVRPGARLTVGPVLLEITEVTQPVRLVFRSRLIDSSAPSPAHIVVRAAPHSQHASHASTSLGYWELFQICK